MAHPGHPTGLPECMGPVSVRKTLQLCLKTVPSTHMYLKCLDGGGKESKHKHKSKTL